MPNELLPGLDHIANFLNALDTEGMSVKDVRTAIYIECLEPKRRPSPATVPDGELVERIGDAFADVHNDLVVRGKKTREPTLDELAAAAVPFILSARQEGWNACEDAVVTWLRGRVKHDAVAREQPALSRILADSIAAGAYRKESTDA